MKLAAAYSFNGGEEEVTSRFPVLLTEINQAIGEVDASIHRTKRSTEKTMPGKMLYSRACKLFRVSPAGCVIGLRFAVVVLRTRWRSG